MKINNVIICGLGALGLTYANKIKDYCNLKILADSTRINKYKNSPPKFNSKAISLEYITPDMAWDADLIIISTKANGLNSAIDYIKNFVKENTIIISLINGISSEETIAQTYKNNVIRSFFIGHSAIRQGLNVSQDGIGKIVIEQNQRLEEFFSYCNIDYEISNDIIYSQWLKLGVNIILNEPTAIHEITVGELRKRKDYFELSKHLLKEIQEVAIACGINILDDFENAVLSSIDLISDSGTTSMYQDVIAKRKTEIEIFSGEIIKLGKKHGIKTPYNQKMYDIIKEKERFFE